jgi:Uma2 family endonuclease
MAITADPRITIHPIDIEHYELMVERGVLGEDDHVELLNGMLSKVSPQGDDHAEIVWWLNERFTLHAPAGGYAVRPQLPMRLPPASMPEPDVALAARPPERRGHPAHAWLAIEVSVTSTWVSSSACSPDRLYRRHGRQRSSAMSRVRSACPPATRGDQLRTG